MSGDYETYSGIKRGLALIAWANLFQIIAIFIYFVSGGICDAGTPSRCPDSSLFMRLFILLSVDLIFTSYFLIEFMKISYHQSSYWLRHTSIVFIISSAIGRYYFSRDGSHYENVVNGSDFLLNETDLWLIYFSISSLFFGLSLLLISNFDVNIYHKSSIRKLGGLNLFGAGLIFRKFSVLDLGFVSAFAFMVKALIPVASIYVFIQWFDSIGKSYEQTDSYY